MGNKSSVAKSRHPDCNGVAGASKWLGWRRPQRRTEVRGDTTAEHSLVIFDGSEQGLKGIIGTDE